MKEQKLIRVDDSPIDHASAVNLLNSGGQNNSHGAEIIFFGVVRNINLGRQVTAVSYEAFAPLTENVFLTICSQARERWGEDLKICILHRTGKLLVGDISLAIAVSSKHRDESYKVSRFVIEQIKERAPIWKKEFYIDGESEWLKGHALCQSDPGHAENPPLSSETL